MQLRRPRHRPGTSGNAGGTRLRGLDAVRRDRLTDESADEDRQRSLCQIMWWLRHAVVGTTLAVVGWRDPTAAETLATAGMMAVQVIEHAAVRVRPRWTPGVTYVDVAIFVALALTGLPTQVVLIVSIAILGWAAAFRPVAAAAALLGVWAALAATVATRGEPAGYTTLGTFALLAGVLMMRTIRLNMGARASAERERLVADRVDALLWEEVPGSAGALKVSAAAERLLGHPAHAWRQPGFFRSLVHPDDLLRFDEATGAAESRPSMVRVLHRHGAYRWLENRVSSVRDRNGDHAFAVGVLTDRTEQVEAQREALTFGHLVASSPIGQMLLRCEGAPVVEAINPACERLLGVAGVEGRSLDGLHEAPVDIRALVSLLRDGLPSIEFAGADGRVYHATAHRADDTRCSVDFLDITERVEASRLLHKQARTDDLTGLPNRRAFTEELERTVHAWDGPTAVLLLDLDRFKDINDSLGHEAGDEFLRRVGDALSGASREGELVARLGGDEFAVIVQGADASTAEKRARALAEVASRPVDLDGLRMRTRLSIGIAAYPTDASTPNELMRCADVAMYRAKSRGTTAESYRPDDDVDDRGVRVALTAELDSAIELGELCVHHQPLLDLSTGQVVGTEALVRWQHPTRGLIPPLEFIELAEASGAIRSLTRNVLDRTIADLASLRSQGVELEASMNLSVRNLYEIDFTDWLVRALARHGVGGGHLVLEITESMIAHDRSAVTEMLHSLAELGVRTWIDDFGTGYSSLSRLRELPVHGVKIDRSFIASATSMPRDRSLLAHLIDLVHSLDLRTIAEGVEDAETLDLLASMDCDLAQGFHIGRPMSLPDLERFLAVPEAAAA